jgi:hypothetical protein
MSEQHAVVDEDYPRADERLFSGGTGDWWLNAHVRLRSSQDAAWDHYIEGYKIIAQLGLEHLRRKHFDLNGLVFPIVFNYRHHFELCLKAIILFGNRLYDTTFSFPGHHRLPPLWQAARQLIERRWGNDAVLDAAQAQIEELDRFDPDSFAYRYPVAKDGETCSHPERDPNRPGEPFEINIEHFCQVAERLSSFLGECAYGLSCEVWQKEDWESEMPSEMLLWKTVNRQTRV